MKRLKKSRLTLLLAGLLLLAVPFEAMAVETIRIRPRRIVIRQGEGAVAVVVTRAVPPQRRRYVTYFDASPLPPGASAFFFPDYLLFPDRGHLFVDVGPTTPVGVYTVHVTAYEFTFEDVFVGTITTTFILDVRPAISPSGPSTGNKRARP